MTPKTDIEIARAATLRPIADIAAKLEIPADALIPYGHDKAKIGGDFITRRDPIPKKECVKVGPLEKNLLPSWFEKRESGLAC